MMAMATQTVWQHARKAFEGLFILDEPQAPAADPWAGRRFTILHRLGESVDVADETRIVETITLPYGALRMIDAHLAAHDRVDAAGLMLVREPFELEGLQFWRWAIL